MVSKKHISEVATDPFCCMVIVKTHNISVVPLTYWNGIMCKYHVAPAAS